MSSKELKIIDLNLFSGSGEPFRTAVGGYYDILSASDGEVLISTPYYNRRGDGELGEPPYVYPFIAAVKDSMIKIDEDVKKTIDDEVLIPNYRFPIRLEGNSEYVRDSNHWKTILLGGTFGHIDYDAIYSDSVFDNHSFDYSLPYSQKEYNSMPEETEIASDVIQITYEYNYYHDKYQKYIDKLDSELLIPNLYLLKMYQIYADEIAAGDITIDKDIENFVTLEGTYTKENGYAPGNLLDEVNVLKHKLRLDHVDEKDLLLSQYLTSSIILNPLSASTISNIKNKFQNIIFDDDAMNSGVYQVASDEKDIFPFYIKFNFTAQENRNSSIASYIENNNIKFNFTAQENSSIASYIEDNDYDSKFMKLLKETFNEDLEDLTPEDTEFVTETTFISASSDRTTYSEHINAENSEYRTVDFLDMLLYSKNNIFSETDDCYFMGDLDEKRLAALDDIGYYRYVNSIGNLKAITEVINSLDTDFDIENLADLYNLRTNTNETLAYRIEKIGGLPSGDSKTQNVLQNFWFFNSDDFMQGSEFYDSQVKYGKDYTYNVYAYVLSTGVKYSFSDLRLTRVIGTVRASTDSEVEKYCLEFYNPETDEAIESLYINEGQLNSEYATDAQLTSKADDGDGSDSRYKADFYLNCEPSLKLLEIPVFSKTLKVMDHIPNQVNISPYQYMDMSQKLGFTVNYEIFNEYLNYPSTISSNDDTIKNDYLNANDIIEDEGYIDNVSVSRQRYFEVYRLDKKPTSIGDFDKNLIKTIDLRDPVTLENFSTAQADDKIITNKKYYYLFRTLNEQGMPGHLSEIYESQLINDGGYLYSIFNIIFESDLEEDIFVNPARAFKKIFELKPNLSQMAFKYDDVDFDSIALTQLENLVVGSSDDTIWNKQFKVRLTSKKTGKKIDLNFTYKLLTE